MYWSDFNKVIKAQDIKLTDPPVTASLHDGQYRPLLASLQADTGRARRGGMGHERAGSKKKTPTGFISGICHIPENEADFNDPESNRNRDMDIEAAEVRDIDAEIEEFRKQAEEKIKIASKEAYDKGFSKGVRDGMEREKRKLALAAESVAKLIRELKALKEAFLKGSEKEIIGLVFSIAESVIHKEVRTDREVVFSVLRDAMRNMRERDGVSIRLNPEDYRYITDAKPDFLNNFGNILIEKDEKIGRGGAVINTHSGALDARLDQQLDKIRDQVCQAEEG